jgi:hypothetical protein
MNWGSLQTIAGIPTKGNVIYFFIVFIVDESAKPT